MAVSIDVGVVVGMLPSIVIVRLIIDTRNQIDSIPIVVVLRGQRDIWRVVREVIILPDDFRSPKPV